MKTLATDIACSSSSSEKGINTCFLALVWFISQSRLRTQSIVFAGAKSHIYP
jgi:hypothetical protein